VRTRKEIADVSDTEFDLYAGAVNTLMDSGDWTRLVSEHEDVFAEAHTNDKFLHWHRKYLYDMETLIQAAANRCDVTLPYWNWALDHSLGGNNPKVFGNLRFGTASGTVNDGKFTTSFNPRIVRGSGQAPLSAGAFSTLESALEARFAQDGDVAGRFSRVAMPSSPWGGQTPLGFAQYVEENWHNSWHNQMGGDQLSSSSPRDPIFFSHHAFVDKIWFDWQEDHLDITGDERDWTDVAEVAAHRRRRSSWQGPDIGVWNLPNLVCENGLIPSSDVEVSMHMTGTQNGRVQYLDRNEDFDCGGDWAQINCCMRAVSAAAKWHEVGRIRADRSDVNDVCNPMGDHDWAQDQAFVKHIQAQGAMTQAQAQANLAKVRQDLHELDQSLPSTFANTGTTSCEKKMCMAITSGEDAHNLMGVCASVPQQCF